MHTKNMLKAVATCAMGLLLLASTASEALWVQKLPETEVITQFHGDPESAQLRLFMAGNQFVVMDNLIVEFKKQYPKYQEIYYVTIPPGKELQWILQGGAEWRAAGFPNIQELIKPDPDDPATWVMNTTTEQGAGFKMLDMPDVYTTVARGHMNQLAAKIDTANEKNNRAAPDFLKFLKSPEAQVILERAGFIPATQTELNTTIPLP